MTSKTDPHEENQSVGPLCYAAVQRKGSEKSPTSRPAAQQARKLWSRLDTIADEGEKRSPAKKHTCKGRRNLDNANGGSIYYENDPAGQREKEAHPPRSTPTHSRHDLK